jgi:hypothetical protein
MTVSWERSRSGSRQIFISSWWRDHPSFDMTVALKTLFDDHTCSQKDPNIHDGHVKRLDMQVYRTRERCLGFWRLDMFLLYST